MAKQGVFRRGNIWWIRYTGLDGRQVRESSQSKLQRDAEALLTLRKQAVQQGQQPEHARIKNYTFRELAERYLEFIVKQKAFRTKTHIVQYLVREFGSLPLKHFSLDFVERFQSRLLSDLRSPAKGSDVPRPPLEPATVNRRLATLKHMFTKAGDWRMVGESVSKDVHKVKLTQENNRRDRFLSREEIERLLAACGTDKKQKHLRPLVLFALNTGCRREEILSLKWSQVDLRHGFIVLERTKNGERRNIPVNEPLREMLTKLVRRVNVEYVFFDPETGRRYRDIKRSFHTALRKAGIVDFVFHDLRHTFASHLVMAGVDLATVAKLLGHKSLAMTLRYSHLAPKHLSNAVDALAAALAPRGEGTEPQTGRG